MHAKMQCAALCTLFPDESAICSTPPRVKPEDLPAWREQLRQAGIPIEREVDWDEGGRPIYFRDLAGNIFELAPPTIWGSGWEF